MHAKIYFWIFVVWKYDMIFLETWPYARKQDIFLFYNFLFTTFQRKLDILIPDLYLYSIKYKLILSKNLIEKYTGKSLIFLKGFFWNGPTRPSHFGLGRCCLTQLTVESELIHSPLFTCKTMEGAHSGVN
jgi:hypothetical protein